MATLLDPTILDPHAAAHMAQTVELYARKDTCLNESELGWIAFEAAPDMLWKPLRFDMTNGRATTLSKVNRTMSIGRHRHDGTVMVYTLQGQWHYKEYDWVAVKGSLVCEAPGAIHSLVVDTPDMMMLSIFDGATEIFGDDGGYVGIQNIFSFVDHYVRDCKARGVPVDNRLFA